jgi:hypothetical protein
MTRTLDMKTRSDSFRIDADAHAVVMPLDFVEGTFQRTQRLGFGLGMPGPLRALDATRPLLHGEAHWVQSGNACRPPRP